MSYEGPGIDSPVVSRPWVEVLPESTFSSFPIEIVS